MTTPTLYISQRGVVACAKHGGYYLSAALVAYARPAHVGTPLDHWVCLSAAEVVAHGITCEGCAR